MDFLLRDLRIDMMMILLVLYLIAKTFRHRNKSLKHKCFHYLLWVGLSQILLVVAILYGDTLPQMPVPLDFSILLAYFFGLCLCTYGWFTYSELTIDSQWIQKKSSHLLLITPLVIYFLLCVSSWWTHWLMYVDNEGKYQRGQWSFLQFLIPGIYVIVLVCRAMTRWVKTRKFDPYQRGVLFFPMIYALAIVLQIKYGGDYIVIATITSLAVAYIELYSIEEFELETAVSQAEALQREKNMIITLHTDTLTKLPNRRALFSELEDIIKQKQQTLYCVLNMHDFKRINLIYGQQMGDTLLFNIGGILREAFPDQKVFRLSGDEFCFLYTKNELSQYVISSMAYNLFEVLHKIKVEGLEKERLNFSIGLVTITPEHHHTPDDVITEGEIAQKMARQHTGNFIWSEQGSIPDVLGCFLELSEDRVRYNEINDRLFSIHNEQDWFNYLHDGAILKEKMYKNNVSNIDDILAYFKNTELPDFEYDHLFNLVTYYAFYIDPFMFEMLVNDILIPYYEKQDPSDKVRSYLGHLYLLMADCLISVLRMGDESQHSRILEFLKKTRDITCHFPHDSIRFEPYFYALCEIVGHYESMQGLFCSMEYIDEAYAELRELLSSDDRFVIPNRNVYEYFSDLVENARLFPVYRACHLLFDRDVLTEAEKKEYAERLAYIQAHQQDGVYDLVTDNPQHRRFVAFLQSILFTEQTTCQIVDHMMVAMHHIRTDYLADSKNSNIVAITYVFLGLTKALGRCAKPLEEKRRLGIESMECLIEILRKRQSYATDNQVLLLNQMLMRSMASTPILTPDLKYNYILQTISASMLDTYCHSKAVASYAKLILSHIIDERPELLVGADHPYATVDEAKANRDNLLQFMEYACMLHDIGKMNIIPITSNAYRRLTDQEFGFIRRHPAFGISYLAEDKAFASYIPFAYEHHRWFNGQGGYPKVEPGQTLYTDINTGLNASKIPTNCKVLIDLLSICDSLEAATSRIGRNYRTAKTFLQILDEFITDAGTRYNAEIINFIISSQETFLQLRQRVDKNWQKEYLAIFQEVVSQPTGNSAS